MPLLIIGGAVGLLLIKTLILTAIARYKKYSWNNSLLLGTKPSNKPLNGAILASTSWRNSESANNTPVRNAPNVVYWSISV
jgi:hypothetical protein